MCASGVWTGFVRRSRLSSRISSFSRDPSRRTSPMAWDNRQTSQLLSRQRRMLRHIPLSPVLRMATRPSLASAASRSRVDNASVSLLRVPCSPTSAVDSATEDEIQKAIRRLLQGRTTLLITHRLSQIRWADKIVVLKRGELIDQGSHAELLERCETYRRIFAHYEITLPASQSVSKTET